MTSDKPWYETSFDADYPLMQRAEDSWTPVQTASVELLLDLPPRARILDLACGYGRHSRKWKENAYRPVGLDFSLSLLHQARKQEPRLSWVRGDIRRLPFAAETFDAATSLFTSFGYFQDITEDKAAAQEAYRILRPGGGIYIDVRNPEHLRSHIPPEEEITIEGYRIIESSHINDSSGEVRYEIFREVHPPGRPPKKYMYSLRLFEPETLKSLLEEAGFANINLYGHYNGVPVSPTRPRLIATGKKM
ncbi:MAG: methyltransferase domain-containing protein [bacterium]|nr:methyltransferase domain-containing protein [bacterium]